MISDEEARQLEQRCVYNVYREMAPVLRYSHYERRPNVERFLQSLPTGSLIADIGCGNGKYLRNNPVDRIIIGSDICQELVDIASQGGKEVLVCDNLVLPYRQNMFDAVISISVLHHLVTSRRRRKALQELSRILKPGGVVLISVWAFEQAHRKFNTQDVLIPWKQDESSPKRQIKGSVPGLDKVIPNTSTSGHQESASYLTTETYCSLCLGVKNRKVFSAAGSPEHSNNCSESNKLVASKNGVSSNGVNLNGINSNGVNSIEDISNAANSTGVKPNGIISNGIKSNGVKLTLVNSTVVNSNGITAEVETVAQGRLSLVRHSLSGLISRAFCSDKALNRQKSQENGRKIINDETFAVRQFPLSSYPVLREDPINQKIFQIKNKDMYFEDPDLEINRDIDDDQQKFKQDTGKTNHLSKFVGQSPQENGSVRRKEQESNVNCDMISNSKSANVVNTAIGNELNEITDVVSRNSTMRFYHLFRESELENMIRKYVPLLTVIESYYDHSNWCVVAKKSDTDVI